MATALASLYTACPARNDTAMTGEITLTGLVFPLAASKRSPAARRAGIQRVILPKENEKDLRELPVCPRRDDVCAGRAHRGRVGGCHSTLADRLTRAEA